MKINFEVDTPYVLEDYELVHIRNSVCNYLNFILGNPIIKWLWSVL